MWSRSRSSFSTSSVILLLGFFLTCTCCHGQISSVCVSSSCGNINNITFPFRLKDDPRNCGDPNFELDCLNNRTILHLNSRNYYVQSIDYERFSIQVVESALEDNNSCSFPLNSTEESISDDIYRGYSDSNSVPLVFIQCLNPVKNSSQYVDISFCSNRNNSSSINSSKIHRYIVVGNDLTLADLEASCGVETVIRSARWYSSVESSLSSIHEAFVYGFELSWMYSLCSDCNGHGDCIIESNSVVCRPYSICYENVPLSELPFRCA